MTNDLYNPTGSGAIKAAESVQFVEATPPDHLRGIVHRYLDIQTTQPLEQDYRFHALPDACTYLVFDQLAHDVAGVTRLRASSEELNLGTRFHYSNIRFLPGVWRPEKVPVVYGLVNHAYDGDLPLGDLNKTMADRDFEAKQALMTDLVEQLVIDGVVVSNPVTEKIFQQIDEIYSVADMADAAQLSPRQLQRTLKRTTGFTPHDFLKVLRLQQSLRGEPSLSYADQSHFIHSFRKATGYTPGQFSRKFDV